MHETSIQEMIDNYVEPFEEEMDQKRSRGNEVIQKDSIQSWLVCLGAAFLVGIAMSMTNCFGVLFVSWTHEFQGSRAKIAWIGAFQYICYLSFCPASGILTQYYSFRPVVLLGSILLCLGLLLSSFLNHIYLLYLTYGVIFGTGVSLLFMPSILVLPMYFQRHLNTATGLVIAANSSFTMWYAPMYEYLIRRYGWRAALRIVTCFLIPLVVACCLFPSKKKVPSLRDKGNLNVKKSLKRLLKNKEFLTWCLLMTLVYLWQLVPTFHLIAFADDIGIPTYISVYSITLMYGMDAVGKVVSGKLIDILHWNVHTFNILSLLTLAVSVTLLPLAKTTAHVFTIAAFLGCSLGIQSLCVIIITPKLTHPDDSRLAVTYLFAGLSLPGGAGPGVAAWIFDMTRSYHLAFLIAGAFFACAACLSILVESLVSRNTNRNYTTMVKMQEQLQISTSHNTTDIIINK